MEQDLTRSNTQQTGLDGKNTQPVTGDKTIRQLSFVLTEKNEE